MPLFEIFVLCPFSIKPMNLLKKEFNVAGLHAYHRLETKCLFFRGKYLNLFSCISVFMFASTDNLIQKIKSHADF